MVFEDAPYAGVTAKKAGFALCGMAEPAYAEGEHAPAGERCVRRAFLCRTCG